MTKTNLRIAISKALNGPGQIPLEGHIHRSAIVALSVHCLFIENGFVNFVEEINRSTLSRFLDYFGIGIDQKTYTPPETWLSVLPSPEFVFRYKHPRSNGVFFLHCSVKENTEQMLVRVCEENQMDNVHFVGLLVSNTVPESSTDNLKRMESWDGVFGNLELLEFNITTHITGPLIQDIEQQLQSGSRRKDSPALWKNPWLQYSLLMILISVFFGSIIHKRRNAS
eukprot:g6876.t1